MKAKPILVVFLTVVLDLVGFGIVIPLLTFYAETFHATPEQVTLLMACYSLAQFVCAPLWGQLSDRIGRRPVMLLSVGMTALMLAGFAGSTSLWMLFLFRTLHGAMTANISTAQACMADLTTPENRAKGMGLIGAGFGIGFTLGPVIGGVLASDPNAAPGVHALSAAHLAVPLWLAAGLSALNFLLAVAWLPETRHAGSSRSQRSISPAALWRALSLPTVGLCIALSALQVFSFALMESTFTLFAWHQRGMGPMANAELFGLVGIVGVIIQGGLIGRLVKRFGERPFVPIGLGVLAIGVALLPFAPGMGGLACVFAVMAVGQALATPSLQALISRGAAADEQGAILGSSQSLSALSRAAGPTLGGQLYGLSPGLPFLMASALLIGAVGLAIPATARAVVRKA
jgi:DHA1 family tetracycline resistance protein-like MFS transporter